MIDDPTPYPEVDALLRQLLESVQSVLGDHLIGLYLDGSLTSGDFDQDSDIDFIAVTDQDISGELFSALQAMHDRLAALDTPWAIQLEGSYISQAGIRRFDPQHALHPNLERGRGERLKMVFHAENWAIHRYIVRQRGITLIGPDPKTLIDPVSPDELRRAVQPKADGWLAQLLEHPERISSRGWQSYIVLTICRKLHTLQFGDVVSKQIAARWAQETLEAKWSPLIERAWFGRSHPDLNVEPEDLSGTLEFIRYLLEHSQQTGTSLLP